MNLPKDSHLAFIAAAGTGGHIIPGLAIAAQLQTQGWRVQWLGTTHGMENTLVPPTGIALQRLNFAGLRGKGILGMIKGAGQMLAAFIACLQAMRHNKPTVLIGMGGYICVPAAWAARLSSVPIILINADADLLLSNRSLAKFAKTICCGFDGATAKLPNAVLTGNSIRSSVIELGMNQPPAQRYATRTGELNILIVGGSLGAQVLNETVPAALALLKNQLNQLSTNKPAFNIQHQTGAKHFTNTQAAYTKEGITAQVLPFIDDMAAAYAWADVVICRAGAITVSELCVAGVPAILVPFLASTTHHQAGNAAYLANAGAGIHLPQAKLTPQVLADTLQTLTRDKLQIMAQTALKLGNPQATQAVVNVIEQTIINKN